MSRQLSTRRKSSRCSGNRSPSPVPSSDVSVHASEVMYNPLMRNMINDIVISFYVNIPILNQGEDASCYNSPTLPWIMQHEPHRFEGIYSLRLSDNQISSIFNFRDAIKIPLVRRRKSSLIMKYKRYVDRNSKSVLKHKEDESILLLHQSILSESLVPKPIQLSTFCMGITKG